MPGGDFCAACALVLDVTAMPYHKRIDKPCQSCGAMMRQVDATRRFCEDCAAIRRRERVRRLMQKKYSKKAAQTEATPVLPLPPLGLNEVANSAFAEGLSYGAYSVKHKLYERRR